MFAPQPPLFQSSDLPYISTLWLLKVYQKQQSKNTMTYGVQYWHHSTQLIPSRYMIISRQYDVETKKKTHMILPKYRIASKITHRHRNIVNDQFESSSDWDLLSHHQYRSRSYNVYWKFSRCWHCWHIEQVVMPLLTLFTYRVSDSDAKLTFLPPKIDGMPPSISICGLQYLHNQRLTVRCLQKCLDIVATITRRWLILLTKELRYEFRYYSW